MQTSTHTLGALVDLLRLQRMCDSLAAAAGGVALAVLDPHGAILIASGWQDICTRFHRVHQEALEDCLESDLRITKRLRDGIDAPECIAYRCANGLWDVAFPLMVDGQHLASVFAGQFFYDDDEIDEASFRERARRLGFDEAAYMDALARVPVLSHQRVAQTIGLLADFVGMLAETGLSALPRERERDALRQSEDKFSKAFLGSPDAILITRVSDGQILDVNESFIRLSGFSREEAVGRSTIALDLWADPGDRERCVTALRDEGSVRDLEFDFRTRSGEVLQCMLSGSLIDVDGEPHILLIVRDITERKQAETEIRRLNDELEERVLARTAELGAANKELEAFAYSVSHDLRAPLRHISGFSALLAERVGDGLDEKSSHYVDTISRSVREMGVLIDDLLQFSRTGRAEMTIEQVDMDATLAEAMEPLRLETADRDIEWTIGRLPAVIGDHALLRQVWANLLGNAVKYSRGREPARIEVGAHDGDGADEDVFWVRDNGVGFDMQYAHKLFSVFQRLHSSAEFEGTGIGLANVGRIVTRLGGRAWAEGEVDHGATFWFSLPRRKDTPS